MVVGVNPTGRLVGYNGYYWRNVFDMRRKDTTIAQGFMLVYITRAFVKALKVAKKLSISEYLYYILTDLKFFSYGFGRFLILLQLYNYKLAIQHDKQEWSIEPLAAERWKKYGKYKTWQRLLIGAKYLSLYRRKRAYYNTLIQYIQQRKYFRTLRKHVERKWGSANYVYSKSPFSRIRRYITKKYTNFTRPISKSVKKSRSICIYNRPIKKQIGFERFSKFLTGPLHNNNPMVTGIAKRALIRNFALFESYAKIKKRIRKRKKNYVLAVKLRYEKARYKVHATQFLNKILRRYRIFKRGQRYWLHKMKRQFVGFIQKKRSALLRQRVDFFSYWMSLFKRLKKFRNLLQKLRQRKYGESLQRSNRIYLIMEKINQVKYSIGSIERSLSKNYKSSIKVFYNLMLRQMRVARSYTWNYKAIALNNKSMKRLSAVKLARKIFSIYSKNNLSKSINIKEKPHNKYKRFRRGNILERTSSIIGFIQNKATIIRKSRSSRKIGLIILKRGMPWWFIDPIRKFIRLGKRRIKARLNKHKFSLDNLLFKYVALQENLRFKFFINYLAYISNPYLDSYLKKTLGNYYRLDIKIKRESDSGKVSIRYVMSWLCFLVEAGYGLNTIMKKFMWEIPSLGITGWKFCISGRLSKRSIATFVWKRDGSVPIGTATAAIEYAKATVPTRYGIVGLKIWLNRGNSEQFQEGGKKRKVVVNV